MTDINIQDLDSNNVPFFARYLEGQMEQVSEAEAAALLGGKSKIPGAPSPGVTNRLADQLQTQKFPSDQEDVSQPIMTQKFPSDQEDIAQITQFG